MRSEMSALKTIIFLFTCIRAVQAENVALGKTATQSSTAEHLGTALTAQLAVDGRSSGNLTADMSCSQTQDESDPYWLLDLGKSHKISNIRIKNRADCCWNELRNVEIRIGDKDEGNFKSNTLCKHVVGGFLSGENITIWCDQPLDGQFVSIQIISDDGQTDQLTICELQAFEFEKVRLEYSGLHDSFGRIEIFDGNEWGTVCDTTSTKTYELICSMLGYVPDSVAHAMVDVSATPTKWKTVSCTGIEASIDDCELIAAGENESCKVLAVDCDPITEVTLIFKYARATAAQGLCTAFDKDSALCSYQDLEYAFGNGYDICTPGFADDCTMYAVIQRETTCGVDTFGVVEWDSKRTSVNRCNEPNEAYAYCRSAGDRITRSGCPEGWYLVDYATESTSRNTFCYKLVSANEELSVVEADGHCQNYSGVVNPHLTSIASQIEQDTLVSYLLRSNKKAVDVMIGLTIHEDGWSWIDKSLEMFATPLESLVASDYVGIEFAAFLNSQLDTSWKLKSDKTTGSSFICKGRPFHGIQVTSDKDSIPEGDEIFFSITMTALDGLPFTNLSFVFGYGLFRQPITATRYNSKYFGTNLFETSTTVQFRQPGRYSPYILMGTGYGEEKQYIGKYIMVHANLSDIAMVINTNASEFLNPPGDVDINLQYITQLLDVSAFYGVMCTLDFGDGKSLTKEFEASFGLTMVVTHTYGRGSVGEQKVSATCSNMLGSSVANTAFTLLQPLGELFITGPSWHYSVEDTVRLEVVCKQGSHVTYAIAFGDGNSEEKKTVEMLCSEEVVVVTHKYEVMGNYTIEVNAKNDLDDYTNRKEIVIQNPVRGLEMDVDYPITYPRGEVEFRIKYVGDTEVKPSNMFGVWKFPEEQKLTTYAASISENGVYQYSRKFDRSSVGTFQTLVNCSNLISSQLLAVNVTIEETIQGLDVQSSLFIAKRGESVEFTVSATAGSNVNLSINYGDSHQESRMHPHLLIDSNHVLFPHEYSEIDNYTVSVSAENLVSETQDALMKHVIVQDPIQSFNLSCTETALYPGGIVDCWVWSELSPAPTDVFCEWTYSDRDVLKSFMGTLTGDGQRHKFSFRVALVDIGFITIKVNCSNFVSESQTYTANTLIMEKLDALMVDATPMHIRTHSPVTLTVRLSGGTGAKYTIYFGDGTIVQDSNDGTASIARTMFNKKHTYTEAGIYTIFVNADNGLSVENASIHNITVQNGIYNLTVDSNSPVKFPEGNGEFRLTINRGMDFPTNLTCEIDFGDGTPVDVMNIKEVTTDHFTHMHRYAANSIGTHNTHVTCRNLVTHYRVTLPVTIEQEITDLRITANRMTAETSNRFHFQLTVTNGSHINYTIHYGDEVTESLFLDRVVSHSETVDFYHKYARPGFFTVIAEGRNQVSSATVQVAGAITTQNPIQGLTIEAEPLISLPPGISVHKIMADNSSAAPTAVTCTWYHADGANETIEVPELSQYLPFENTKQYSRDNIGELQTTVNCSNLVSAKVFLVSVTMEEIIEGLNITADSDILETNTSVTFTISIQMGSAVIFSINFGDGVSRTIPNIASYKEPVAIGHSYRSPGKYTVNVVASNKSSKKSKRYLRPIIVQNVVKYVTIAGKDLVAMSEGSMVFTLSAQPSHPPTDVTCTWLFGNGSTALVWSPSLTKGYPHQLRYHLSEKDVGLHTTVVNCSNLINWASTSQSVLVQVDISETSIYPSTYNLMTNGPVDILVKAQSGTNVSFTLEYGDGTSETKEHTTEHAEHGVTMFNHSYKRPGNYKTRLIAANRVSREDLNSTRDIVVQNPVRGLSFTGPQLIMVPPGVANFKLEIADGVPLPTGVIVQVEYEDTGIEHVDVNGTFDSDNPVEFLHKYTEEFAGTKTNLTVKAYNRISEMTFKLDIDCQAGILGLKITPALVPVEPDQEFDFNVTFSTGTNLKLSLDLGDGHETMTFIGSKKINSFSHAYSKEGVNTISVNMSNNLGYSLTNQTVIVQYPISNITIATLSPLSLPSQRSRLVISADPEAHRSKEINATIYFGDGSHETLHNYNFKKDIELLHNYSVGVFQAKAELSNHINNRSVSIMTQVFEAIDGLKIELSPRFVLAPPCVVLQNPRQNYPQFAVGESTNWACRYTRGSNITANWHLDEKTNKSLSLENPSDCGVTHQYKEAGIYTINMNLSNVVSASYQHKIIQIRNKAVIKDVTLDHVTFTSTNHTTIVEFDDEIPDSCVIFDMGDGTVVVYGNEICSHLNLSQCSNTIDEGSQADKEDSTESNGIMMNSTNTVNSTQRSTDTRSTNSIEREPSYSPSHVSPVSTDRTDSLTNGNLTSRSKRSIDGQVSSSESPSNVIMTEPLIGLNTPNVTMSLSSTDSPSTTVSPDAGAFTEAAAYLFTTGSSVENETRSSDQSTQSPTTSSTQVTITTTKQPSISNYTHHFVGTIPLVLRHNHTYEKEGSYNITIRAVNLVSEDAISRNVTAYDPEPEITCLPPMVIFKGIGENSFEDPFRSLKSVCVPVQIEAISHVTCPNATGFYYTWALEVYDSENDTFRAIDLPGMPDGGPDEPRIKFPELSLEVELYQVIVNVTVAPYNVTKTAVAYMQVTPSSIRAGIVGGPFVRGSAQTNFTVNAEGACFDPDVESTNKTGMTFTWFCRKLPPHGIDLDLLSNFSNACFVDENATALMEGGRFTLDPHTLEANTTYEFTVELRKDIRKAVFKQKVEMIEGIPPTMLCNCVKNCNKKANPTLPMWLQARCIKFCSPTMQWKWTIFILDHKTDEMTEVKGINVSTEGDLLKIGPNSLIGGNRYRVLLDSVSDNATGRVEYNIIANLQPAGGRCTVEPETGVALNTSYKVVCSGWNDEGEKIRPEDFGCDEDPTYRVYSRGKGQVKMNLLKEGGPVAYPLSLPVGSKPHNFTIDIVVLVMDKYGTSATVELETQVLNPLAGLSADKQAALLNGAADDVGNELENDPQAACQKIFALVSSMEGEEGSVDKGTSAKVRNNLVESMNKTYKAKTSTAEVMQSASALGEVAKNKDEISSDSEIAASGTMGNMADDVANLNATSEEEFDDAFGQLRGSMGGMMLSNAGANNTELDPAEAAKQAAKAKAVAEAFEKAQETMSVSKLNKMAAGAPAFNMGDEKSPLALKKDSPDSLKGGAMSNPLGEVGFPDDLDLGDEGDEISSQMASYEDNPFSYAEGDDKNSTDDKPSSPITSIQMFGAGGKKIEKAGKKKTDKPPKVKKEGEDGEDDDDEDEGGIGLSIAPKKTDDPNLVTRPLPSGNYSMCHHNFKPNGKNGVFQIFIKPVMNLTLNLYVKKGDFPTPDDYDFKTTLPKGRTDIPADDDLQFTLSIQLKKMSPGEKYTLGIEQVGGENATDLLDLLSGGQDITATASSNIGATPGISEVGGLTTHMKRNQLQPTTSFPGQITSSGIAGIGFVNSTVNQTDKIHERRRREAGEITTTASPDTNGTANETSWFSQYYIQFYELTCQRWDDAKQKWMTDCKVDLDSSPKKVKFKSNLFGNFGAGLFVPPNTIDFSKVFDNIGEKLSENAPVVGTIGGILLLYFILMIVARRLDKKDRIRWMYNPLLDNHRDDQRGFKMAVFTGNKTKAATKSKVFFVLSGEEGDTGLRVLDDGIRENFKKGAVDNFYVSTPHDIGSLLYLRVWHDNSGGIQKAWYLEKVIVTDVMTGKKYNFMCDKWLSKAHDDMKVDRIIPVANKDRLKDAASFSKSARRDMSEDHLMFSVASRPVPSSFTRVQRLSCVISILFLTMISNAMWYKTDEEKGGKPSDKISVGPISFTMNELYTSIMGTLTILPANIAILYFFRNSKRRSKKVQDINAARTTGWRKLKKGKNNKKFDNIWASSNSKDFSEWGQYPTVDVETKFSFSDWWQRVKYSIKLSGKKPKPKKKKSRKLPFWFVYIGWFLVILSIATSAFFTILYSFEWGGVKSTGWLTTFLLSVFQNTLLVNPIKVLVFAALFSLIFKKPPDCDEDDDDDDIAICVKVSDSPIQRNTVPPPLPEVPADPVAEEEEKKSLLMQRLREDVLTDAVKDILSHSFYLFLLLSIAYGMRDSVTFSMNNEMNNLFGDGTGYNGVSTSKNFWDWLEKNMISNLFYESLYNGDSTADPYDRKFVANGVTMRMSPARLRQLRVDPKKCIVDSMISSAAHVSECYQDYTLTTEDTANISRPDELIYDENPSLDLSAAFMYQNSSKLKTEAVWAQLGWYSGSGYVAKIPENYEDALKYVQRLRAADWIDRYTRVVFVEFTVFTMNVNLFTSVRLAYELPTTGSAVISKEITSFNLYRYTGGAGVMSIFAEAVCMLYTLYFTIKEFISMYKKRREYVRDTWNIVNFMSCIFMWACMGMYTEKNMMTMRTIEDVFNNRGKYVSFDSLILIDMFFMFLFAVVVFITQLRFVNILRFQKHVAIVTKTIVKAGKDASWFCSTLFIIFMSFLFLGVTWFAPHCELFKDYWKCTLYLLTLMIGYNTTEETDNLQLGPIFFFLYNFLGLWILTGMLLTILQGAHCEALEEEDMKEQDIDMADYFWGKIKAMIPFFNKEEDEDEKKKDEKQKPRDEDDEKY